MNLLTSQENTIIELVRAVTGLSHIEVFPHRQKDQLRPARTPFVTIDFTGDESTCPDGIINYVDDDGNFRQKTICQYRVTISIRFYGAEAHQLAKVLNATRRSPRAVSILRAGNIGGLQTLGPLANQGGLVATEMESMWRQDYSTTYIIEAETTDVKPFMDTYQVDVTLQRNADSPDARTVTIIPED